MQATFFQNIGAVVIRFTRTESGLLCKRCIDECFVRMSVISFFLGWWGVISFFVTLFTLPLNVVTWLRALSLPPPDAPPPSALGPSSPVDPYAPTAASPTRSGSGSNPLAIAGIALGGLALLVTLGIALVGVGMILAPHHADDPKSGMICIATTTLLCGLPGAIGLIAGVFGLRKRS